MRKKIKAKFLTPLAIIKSVTGSHKSTIPPIIATERKLGLLPLNWDVEKVKETLELRKSCNCPDGCIYHGYWNKASNKKEGWGLQIFQNGSKYEGFWLNNKFHGEGRMIYENASYYSGFWVAGFCEGNGIFVAPDGASYRGEWKKNAHHGFGVEIWPNGSSYEGDHVNGLREGKGKFINANKVSYEGEFIGNNLTGQGINQKKSFK